MTETIKAPNSVTVRSVAAFADRLLDASHAASDIAIDVGALVECDLSFIQLVAALRTHVQAAGRKLSLCGQSSPALHALLDRAGFAAMSPADDQFWFGGERAR